MFRVLPDVVARHFSNTPRTSRSLFSVEMYFIAVKINNNSRCWVIEFNSTCLIDHGVYHTPTSFYPNDKFFTIFFLFHLYNNDGEIVSITRTINRVLQFWRLSSKSGMIQIWTFGLFTVRISGKIPDFSGVPSRCWGIEPLKNRAGTKSDAAGKSDGSIGFRLRARGHHSRETGFSSPQRSPRVPPWSAGSRRTANRCVGFARGRTCRIRSNKNCYSCHWINKCTRTACFSRMIFAIFFAGFFFFFWNFAVKWFTGLLLLYGARFYGTTRTYRKYTRTTRNRQTSAGVGRFRQTVYCRIFFPN